MKDEIKEYFTDDIRGEINEMTNDEMRNYLRDLEGTKAWIAILKYTQDRIANIQGYFLSMDPVKEPSKISQYQGVVTGLLDLQDAVLNLKFESKKVEDPKYKEEKKKDELGGAYNKY